MVWFGALGAQLVAASIVVALGVPISSNTDAINEASADRTYVVSLVITAVIAAPIVEEMVFRGVVLRGLRSRLATVPAVALQGVLFGAAHVDPVRGIGNVGLVMVLSGVGIAFGIASQLLRRIGPSIVAHALFNGAVLLVVLTGVADRLQAGLQVDVRGREFSAKRSALSINRTSPKRAAMAIRYRPGRRSDRAMVSTTSSVSASKTLT